MTVSIRLGTAGPQLSWPSQAGALYRVEAEAVLGPNGWSNISGDIVASGTTCSFTDPAWDWYAIRWYRVVSE